MRNSTTVIAIALLLCPLLLTGCGSMLAGVEANPIEEDPGRRSIGKQVTDSSIETKAIVNIHAANEDFDEASFTVVSYNGFVLITGEVANIQLKDQATEVIRKIEGVRRIYNELIVAPVSDAATRAKDVWLTTKIKTSLLTTSDTPGIRVKVVTENSVVYLLGLVTQPEADRIASEAAEVNGVERVVQLFEII